MTTLSSSEKRTSSDPLASVPRLRTVVDHNIDIWNPNQGFQPRFFGSQFGQGWDSLAFTPGFCVHKTDRNDRRKT
jgi:hypothetical protein